MAGEFCRWYDLKRTGKLYERMNNPDMNEIVAGKFQKYHVLRPIPRDQSVNISVSKMILTQALFLSNAKTEYRFSTKKRSIQA